MTTEPFLDDYSLEPTPLAAMWRYRWLVLALTLLGGGLTLLLATATQSSRFEATASLVVTDPRATTLFSAADVARLDADRYVRDQVAILRSDTVAQRTAELLAGEDPPITLGARAMEDNLAISSTDSNEILVQYSAADEPTAITIVNTVIQAYELVRGDAAARDSASALDQLEQSIADIDDELATIEQAKEEVRRDPMLVELETQYQAALARLAQLQPQLALAAGDRLIELRAELADLDEQIARLSDISRIEDNNQELAQLDREELQATARRSALAGQLDRLLVDTQLLSGGISLASPAQFALKSNPRIPMTILGTLLGFVAGAGLAFLLASRHRKVDERTQPGWVLRTALLAEVPNFHDERVTSEVPVLDYPASASAEAFRFAATTLDLHIARDDQDWKSGAPVNTFLITSGGVGNGKTVLAANLALAAARKGRSVLAIDADFGNQKLTKLLRADEADGPGITEVVEAGTQLEEAIHSLEHTGTLDLLSRGHRTTTAADFFSLPAARAFIESVGRRYDIVLIDGPPMLNVAYASTLARYADSVVIVVQHGTSVKNLEDLSQRLELIRTPLAGYVYNAAPLRYEMTLTEGSLRDVLGNRGPIEASTRLGDLD